MAAVMQNGHALAAAVPCLQDDKEVALAAVKTNGWALVHTNSRLRGDREVVLAPGGHAEEWHRSAAC